jgi:hypothetical protein
MEKPSFIKELFKRRVPQIIGFYIAATWMMIEIGDWMVERFHLAPEITSYIFIGMAFFLPSIFYLAYHYGKPGKDQWKKATFAIVPSNVLIALVAMYYFVAPVVATEIKVVTDEKGGEQTFEVAKTSSHIHIANFFWKNDSGNKNLDWMQYGIAWMLSKDLNRSVFISSYTPFSSSKMLKKFKESGFKNGLNIPMAMQLDISRKRFSQYIVDGTFNVKNDIYTFNYNVVDVLLGKKVVEQSISGNDVFSLIDDLTTSIKNSLEIPEVTNDLSNDLRVSEHISSSMLATEKLIESKVKRHLEKNYTKAKELIEMSVNEDFSFAYAYAELVIINQLSGLSQDAQKAIQQVLKHEYKFTVQEKFKYKSLSYIIPGDYKSSLKVIDMWIELFPNDIEAHEERVKVSFITGLEQDKALDSLRNLRALLPHDYSNLKLMASIFILQNKLEKASDSLNEFLSYVPGNINVLLQVANVNVRKKEFNKARQVLERVILIDSDNLTASLRLISLETKLGNFSLAEEMLQGLAEKVISPEEILQVSNAYIFLFKSRRNK